MPRLKNILILIPLLFATNALADAAAAFTEGTQFGKDNVGNAKGQITSGNASSSVPNYTPTDSASNYYLDGKGSLTAPASGDVSNCTSTPGTSDPNAHTHGKCEGVRMLMSDPGKKNVMFPLDKNTDPLVIERNNVRANPESYLGTLNPTGNYGACVDKTINEPDTYTEEVCNQFIKREDKTCQENLTVTVTKTESCVPGTYIASGVYAARDDTNRIEARCDFDHSNMNFRILSCDSTNGCYGSWRTFTLNMSAPSSGNSPQNAYERVGSWTLRPTTYTSQGCNSTTNTCSITFNIYSESSYCPNGSSIFGMGCNQYCTKGGFPSCGFGSCSCPNGGTVSTSPIITRTLIGQIPLNFSRPRFIITQTDTWDDQCAAYKSRLP